MDEKPQDRLSEADHEPRRQPGEDGVTADAGAHIGHQPELTRETDADIDARATGVWSQPTAGADVHIADATGAPGGHRQGPRAADDVARDAGEDLWWAAGRPVQYPSL